MDLTLSPKQAFELKLRGRSDILDQVEVAEGVIVLGDIQYHEESRMWRALANVGGILSVIELNIRMPDEL